MQIFTMRALTLFTATLATVLGMSLSAQAATVTVTSDKFTYSFGESIILTIIGDTQGDVDQFIFGRLIFDKTRMTAVTGSNTQTKLRTTAGAKWDTGPLVIFKNTIDSFNQIQPGSPTSIPSDSTKKLTSVMVFTARSNPGEAFFSWQTAANAFNFFGVGDREVLRPGGNGSLPAASPPRAIHSLERTTFGPVTSADTRASGWADAPC